MILLLIIGTSNSITGQQKKYTQEEINHFVPNSLKPNTLDHFEAMLKSDRSLIGWVAYYRQKIHIHLTHKEKDSVLFYGKKCIKHFESLRSNNPFKTEIRIEEARLKPVYLYMAIVLSQDERYRESTEYLLSAAELINKYPDFLPVNHPYIYGYLSSNFLEMGDKREALKYRLKVLKDSGYMKNNHNAAVTYHRLGVSYNMIGEKDSAIHYYRKSLKKRILINDYAGERAAYNTIGDYFREKNNLDSTLYYYTKSKELLDLYPSKNYGISKYFSRANYGYVLLKKGNIKKAIVDLNAVLDSINKLTVISDDFKSLKINVLDYLIEANQESNNMIKALEFAKTKNDFLEEFHQHVLDQKLRELNIAYEVKEKETSILQLEKTTEKQDIIIKQRSLILLVLAVLILSILGIGFLIFRQRKLKNKYETANLEQRLLRSQLNPHFVFNALNTVSSLANKNSENTEDYIAKLGNLIRLILKNSREEFVSLKDELKCIKDYLELQSNFSQKFEYEIKVDTKINNEEIYIPPMFIQPFIENSIEHGLRGLENGNIKVKVRINNKDKLIECEITDNGIGISKASKFKNNYSYKSESFSGKILKERLTIYARSLNKKANYTVKNVEKGKGTVVNLSLPFIEE